MLTYTSIIRMYYKYNLVNYVFFIIDDVIRIRINIFITNFIIFMFSSDWCHYIFSCWIYETNITIKYKIKVYVWCFIYNLVNYVFLIIDDLIRIRIYIFITNFIILMFSSNWYYCVFSVQFMKQIENQSVN